MSLSRPCSLHSHRSRLLTTRRCVACASQRASARSTSIISSSCSSADGRKCIFDREAELDQLRSLQRQRPASVTVVLGPRSCGKTAVLQELFAKQADAVYIDCRVIDATTPAGLIEVLLSKLASKVPEDLQESVKTALSRVPGFLAGLLSSMKVTETDAAFSTVSIAIPDLVQAFLRSKEQQQNLNAVYEALRELLTAMEKSRAANGFPWPVVVIDEANVLMEWTDKYPRELASFLRSLVALSKQENRCHVMFATSEYAFQAWLSDAIGPRFWNAEVIGDFPEAAARQFLELELEQQASSSRLDDQAWHKVFQVCGGNAGDLRRLAVQVDSKGGDWDAALEVLWGVEYTRHRRLARGADGWTPEQYAGIALQLLSAEHHALPLHQAEMLLGQLLVDTAGKTPQSLEAAGQAVLQRLVEANALSVRPKSAWASDIPSEAFAAAKAVVTAPSSLDLYCIGQLRDQLEETLQRWKEEQQQQQQQDYEQVALTTGAAAEARRPPSPGSSPEVKEVKQQILLVGQQIERVEQQIQQVEQDIKEAKLQGDREEVAVLRSKEQQLRARLQQLGSDKQQLGEEKLLLLRIYAGNGS